MPNEEKLGLLAFSTKKAETEPWLIQCAFVAPPDFEFLKGDHSTVVYGDAGSGKTAVRIALEHYANMQPKRFLVHWRPSLSENKVEASTFLAMAQLSEVLIACARTLVEKLLNHPDVFKNANPSAQEFLVWFVRHFVFENATKFEPNGKAVASDDAKDLIQDIMSRQVPEFFVENADPIIIAIELTKALENAGFSGTWIMIDGLDWQNDAQRQYLISSLSSMLSTLRLFEIPSFSYKITLPMEFEGELADSVAITRDRAMVFRLSWDIKYLSAIIERRICAAMGENILTLDNIYNTKEIIAWLEGCGGLSPRGWLDYLRPIFSTYWDIISNGKKRKLTRSEWDAARSRSSLHLKFIPDANQIRIGMGIPKTLSSEIAAIFNYLYNNQGRYCTKQELYYKAYMPFIAPQENTTVVSQQLVLPKEYDDLINTVIYRLRQTIEPIPAAPVFITSKRDVGYRLSMHAFQ
jgi:hypothetical protein